MVKLTAIPYEQARLEFFQSLLDKANRRLDWALKNKPGDYNALSERGEEVSYLNWVVDQATQALQATRSRDSDGERG